MNYTEIYDKYYPEDSKLRKILENHSRSVANLASEINKKLDLQLDAETVEKAAMLHDIGVFLTNAPGIECFGTEPYIKHGILGADLLRQIGVEEEIAAVAERHTGAGITGDDIQEMKLPLPTDRCLMPVTLLERLVCFADKFFSKSGDMKQKSLERVRASMAKHSAETLRRFENLYKEFGQAFL